MFKRKNALFLGTAMIFAITVPSRAQNVENAAPENIETSSTSETQENPNSSPANGEIVVTATKRSAGSTILQTPLAVTGFDAAQIAEMNFNSISDLTGNIPNVYLQSNTTAPGFNNFTIRGLAVYSTIPSVTPTVGVFIDDIYQGTPAGAGWQTFDIEALEVLRGPQGLFFGRNVTGGAILVRTTEPTKELSGRFEAGIETGLAYTMSGVVSGPLSDTISAKIGVYWNEDRGYFKNDIVGRDVGRSDALVLRGALSFEPTDRFKSVLRVERAKIGGDGNASQDQRATGLDKFEVNLNEPGFVDNLVWQVTNRSDLDIDFGNGTLTNIFGWRKVHAAGLSDVDSTPFTSFHLLTVTNHEQWSDEFRYSGTFGMADVTAGLFYYWDTLNYIEDRTLLGSTVLVRGGGLQKSKTFAEFVNVDLHITPTLTLNLGQRWSIESKRADVQPLTSTATGPCSLITETCASYSFPNNKDKWKALTPRIGFQFQPDSSTNIYGFYTKGFRSGGFNLRNSGGAVQAYDQEVVKTFEIGAKKRFADGKFRIAVALFRNDFSDLQRDVLIVDPRLGSAQTSANTADVRIQGFEAEATARLGAGFTLSGDVGHLSSKFKRILYDLSGNGVVGPEDFALKLPYLAPWSYGARLNYRGSIGNGEVNARVSYSYHSRVVFNDRNTSFVDPVKRLDASLSYIMAGNHLTFSVYGQNLLDRVEITGINPVALPVNGVVVNSTHAPISRGRVIGAKAIYQF